LTLSARYKRSSPPFPQFARLAAHLLFLTPLMLAPASFAASEDEPLTLELKEARADEVFQLLESIIATPIVVPACGAKAKIDVALKNAPASVVVSVVAREAGLVVTRQGSALVLVCAPEAAAVRTLLNEPITLDAKALPLDVLVASLAQAAGLQTGPGLPPTPVTARLVGVRRETALRALAETAGLAGLVISDGRITVLALPSQP
jgi:NAD(P)H-dependent flavin oxidoreductase YrpB (nitropropane dioxygenase family)